MKSSNARWLLLVYPRDWRERYGQELLAVIEADVVNGRVSRRATLDVVSAGIAQRLRSSGLWGDDVPSEERSKAGLLLVLCSWSLFVVAGIALQRISEHWQSTTPDASQAVPQAAFDAILVGAGVGSLAIVTGVLLVVRPLAGIRGSERWRMVRRSIVCALSATAVTSAVLPGVVVWADRLPDAQRNGGDALYGAAVVVLAACALVTIAAWTAAAVTAARSISLSRPTLRRETVLAALVTLVMAAATAGTAVWWLTVANRTAAVFGPGFSLTMLVLVLLMLAATCFASAGTIRAVHAFRSG